MAEMPASRWSAWFSGCAGLNKGCSARTVRRRRVLVVQLRVFDTHEQLQSRADDWNDLWRRSETALPTGQAEPLLVWLRHFAAELPFRALVVEDHERLVAALPLIGRRGAGVLPIAASAGNQWSSAGELLLDREADVDGAADLLCEGLRALPWPLAWFRGARGSSRAWHLLVERFGQAGMPARRQAMFQVGQVCLPDDFADMERAWSGNHRRHLRKAARRVEAAGGCDLQIYRDLSPAEVEPLVRTGFEMEHRGWKGVAGGSVLASDAILKFFFEQARALAAAGNLRLLFLSHRGQPIAFEYGLAAKGHYFSLKVAYDEAFARFSPGQLLRYRFFEDQSRRAPGTIVDFMGPLSDATGKWVNHVDDVDALMLGTWPRIGGAVIAAMGVARRARNQWRAFRAEGPSVGTAAPLPAH
ncbi:MAG: GNAT family N-acetyltransferase [Planctomycetota bacterium]|nr:MAG: GNAT family N-acetyltransferase [Planctomycetota bacterium]